jgi:hypothetical protein
MNDLIKKRRKTLSKFITFENVIKEYELDVQSFTSLLKEGYLLAFGKFDNDFTQILEKERLCDRDIEPHVWRNEHGWQYDSKTERLINDHDLQSYTNIRFIRKEVEQVISLEFNPKQVRARWYNWEIIAMQICAYMHNQELPLTKGAWFKEIQKTIPYFQTGAIPEYRIMDNHLGIVWDALNSNKVNWNQYIILN